MSPAISVREAMRLIGLTGSIATGKTTTAAMFRAHGVPVFDSDGAVHNLYAGSLAPEIGAAFPGSVVDGRVDRARLAAAVVGDAAALRRLEAIVHPAVRQAEGRFLGRAVEAGHRLAVLDIPLLFETGGDARVDFALVVTVDPAIQRERALSRPDMSPEKLDGLLARQMPSEEKRRRAHFAFDSGFGHERTQRDVAALLQALSATH